MLRYPASGMIAKLSSTRHSECVEYSGRPVVLVRVSDARNTSDASVRKKLSIWVLKWLGWTMQGHAPTHRRCVLIAAPHTSNWDFLYMLLFASASDLQVRWLAKKSLFNPLMGWFMRALGGIAVDRGAAEHMVADLTDVFEREQDMILVVPTEATRARTEYWKSGFYRIAKGAGVPIVPTFLDFSRRQGGFGASLLPTDDVGADMQYFRNFYADKKGLYPEQFGPVRLREEGSGDSA